ncbi:MAG: hypothetical protein WCB12_14135 [Bryobacteraceae bacterium]
MITLSEESRFLLKNWDRVAELMEATGTCQSELADYLHSVKGILRAWDEELQFMPAGDSQCYISRKEWQEADAYVIWIGVENFTPDAIFSATSPPSCYLWVESPRATEIAEGLLAYVKRDAELKGLLATGTSGQKTRYLIQKKLRRWYPEELEDFLSGAPLREIADFMGQVYTAIKDYRLPRKGRG